MYVHGDFEWVITQVTKETFSISALATNKIAKNIRLTYSVRQGELILPQVSQADVTRKNGVK